MRSLVRALLTAAMIALAACGGGDETVSTSTTSTEAVEVVPELDPPEATTNAPPEGAPDESAAPQAPGEAGGGASAAAAPADAEGVIEAVFTGSLPPATICDELLTASYVEEAYGSREGCLAGEKPGALADSVEVAKLDEATGRATVVPTGGPYDGVDVMVELVDDDGVRIASLTADVPAGP